MKLTFSPRQRRVFAALFIAYLAAYLSRTNLAPALPAIAEELSLSGAQAGLLATLFAVSYALGQIAVGFLADRYPPRRFLLAGLIGSSAVNIAFSFAARYPLLLMLWLLNGAFQSLLWTPIVRVLANRFDGPLRNRATFSMSVGFVLGYLLAWLITGAVIRFAGWRPAFLAAGLITLCCGLFSVCLLGADGADAPDAVRNEAAAPARRLPLRALLTEASLMLALLCGVMNGFVRDGIMTWAPKLLIDTQGIQMDSALMVALVIPAVNLLGILLGRKAFGWMKDSARDATALLMGACALFSALLLLFYRSGLFACALFLCACSAIAYGVNPLLTTLLPMEYRASGRVATVAGLVDACIYLGTALAGVASGALRDALGWGSVFAAWTIASALGLLAMLLSRRARGAAAKTAVTSPPAPSGAP